MSAIIKWTIGEELKKIRQQQNFSLRQIADKTKLSLELLHLLEKDNLDIKKHPIIYQKNYIRKYCHSLKINPKPFLEKINEQKKFINPQSINQPTIKKTYFLNLPALGKILLSLVILVIFSSYLGWQIKKTLEPPKLNLFTPNDGLTTNQKTVLISGQTNKEVKISINGQEITNQENGRFIKELNLNPGINTITITAINKHQRQTTITRHIIYKDLEQISFNE